METVRISVDMASDLARAGICLGLDEEATDVALADLTAQWEAGAVAEGARLGYAVEISEVWTSTDDGRGDTVENAIWQAGHDAVQI